MSLPTVWFRLPFIYRPRAERRVSPALAAYHWSGTTPRQYHVANISSSGAYLVTPERWTPGEIVSLTLQRSGIPESSSPHCFTVQAKAVRRESDGMAVAFLMPRGSDLHLWQDPTRVETPQTEPEDVVHEFRIAASLAFIQRIAPGAADHARLLMRKGESNYRAKSAIAIALHAEGLLALDHDKATLHADAAVVMHILEDGSWAEAEWMQHCWAGLLATACRPGAVLKQDLKYVSLFSQITTIQARIFSGSCGLAATKSGREGVLPLRPVTCSAKELVKIAKIHDRALIERDILHLAELGLIKKSVRWRFFSLLDHAEITPTSLAIELYARCHGRPHVGAEVSSHSSFMGSAVPGSQEAKYGT